jgi:predicted permease
MALGYLHAMVPDPSLAYVALMPWVLFLVAIPLLLPLCHALAFPRHTTGCVILVGGMANTSFVGIPMIEAYYGAEWMSLGIVADLLGSYIVLAVLGITLARIFAAGPRPSGRDILLRVVTFPPFIATVVALIIMPVPYPEWLDVLLKRIADTVAPIALISVGFQMRVSSIRGKLAPLIVALGYKLALGPLIIFWLMTGPLGQSGPIAQITIFETAMAPMIGASIVAMDNDLDPPLATLLVGIGVPLSFVTLALWYQILGGI